MKIKKDVKDVENHANVYGEENDEVDSEHIDNLREMFNGIKSVPVVTSEITTKKT